MLLYLRLFYEFFKTGLFTIGGGMATIPFLYKMSDATGWFTYNDLANMIAVGESTPGPIGVNMATYVGVDGLGILGGAWASISLTIPSIIIIVLVAKFLKNFSQNRWVKAAFYTIRPAVAGLIAAAGFTVVASNLFFSDVWVQGNYLGAFNWKGIVLAAVLWILTNVLKPTKKSVNLKKRSML